MEQVPADTASFQSRKSATGKDQCRYSRDADIRSVGEVLGELTTRDPGTVYCFRLVYINSPSCNQSRQSPNRSSNQVARFISQNRAHVLEICCMSCLHNPV